MSAQRGYILGSALKWVVGIVAAAAFLWYAAWEAWPLITGPSLTLTEASVHEESRTATIAGIARNVTAITLNDRPIFTDDDGNFKEELVLENGYTILTLRAQDRYGRSVLLALPLVYTSAYRSPEQTP
jgi:hypothetical protein